MNPSATPIVLAIDGRSGSGKTQLADHLADWARHRGLTTELLPLDLVYPGWNGLAAGVRTYTRHILPSLAAHGTVRWRPWDWHADAHRGSTVLGPADLVIVEGVGAAVPDARTHLNGALTLIADPVLRRTRALARDGDVFAPYWRRWAEQEEQLPAATDRPVDLSIHLGPKTSQKTLLARVTEWAGQRVED